MCGICGMFDLRDEHRVEKPIVEKMINKLFHRGPDSVGFFIKDNLALGFTRLSIIDLEGGMQPLFNEDGTIVLVCNGEIFNYLELRDELSAKGHKFKSNSDVECILHLYEEYNTEFLCMLNGQFAFVIYDFKNNLLLSARDYAGIAPFFYTVADGKFIFGSEIKSIIEYPGVKREVDLIGFDQVLCFPGIVSPRTMFKGIYSLKAGNYIAIKDFGDIRINEYWDLIYPKKGEVEYVQDENYYLERLDEILTKAVKYRLQADVPVGFYISGGLDSSIIASKIKQVSISQKQSFSIDFTDKELSESKYQRIMANHVDSLHNEILFRFDDISKRLRKIVYHSECALKETYNTASIALSESVRSKDIKVILTGEGADELFGGYVGYRFDKLRQQQNQISPEIHVENEIRKKLWGDDNFLYEKNHYAYSKMKKEIYSEYINEFYSEVDCINYPVINKERIEGVDILHKRSYVDFKLRMSDHLLADHGDRMALANSVEARYPFLDKDFIEFVKVVPPYLKLKGFEEKYILKKIATNIVPGEIVKRPKFAFTAPGSTELLKQNIEFIDDILSYDLIKKQGYFNPDKVEELKKQYSKEGFKLNVPYENDFLIIVITFGLFLEEFKMPDLS